MGEHQILYKELAANTSPLLLFPVELLLELFPHLDRTDAICLALSCRRMLQVSYLARLRAPSAGDHRAQGMPACGEITNLLGRIRIREVDVDADDSWRLCADCLYWRREPAAREGESGDEACQKYGSCARAWMVLGSVCPNCVGSEEGVGSDI